MSGENPHTPAAPAPTHGKKGTQEEERERRTPQASRANLDPYAAQHRWIRIRLIGWGLIATWQLLSLASEFIPLDLERRSVRVFGKLLGLIGLVMVAYGFERLAELTHKHVHRKRRRAKGRR